MSAISEVGSGCPPLFERFVGTMPLSYSSATRTRAVWLSPSPALETLPFMPVYPGIRTSILDSGSGSVYQIERNLPWAWQQARGHHFAAS
jgi:hypothetical protein